jgi:hypothetical protein
VGPFGLGNGAFDNNVIDLPVIVSALSLGIKIGVGASSDYEYCVMGGEGIGLLQRFLDWRCRMRRWVSFGFDLRVGIVLHSVCDLWYWRRVCYLWN